LYVMDRFIDRCVCVCTYVRVRAPHYSKTTHTHTHTQQYTHASTHQHEEGMADGVKRIKFCVDLKGLHVLVDAIVFVAACVVLASLTVFRDLF
jgi:hypothetical protein